MDPSRLIASILRHDARTASYKLALIRSLGDVVLGSMHLETHGRPVAVPLRSLAVFWIAYYWPFVDPDNPIRQAHHAANKQDISFRPPLTELWRQWAALVSHVRPADGYFLNTEMQAEHRRSEYPPELVQAYNDAVAAIVHALRQPIRYAGTGEEHNVFPPPKRWRDLQNGSMPVVPLPATRPNDRCVLVNPDLWSGLRDLSLWIEALCIHEWVLFTEAIAGADRGAVYSLLTDRPDNRRPLTWERNQIEILMLEGAIFTCPWTKRRLTPSAYDLDHLLPISVYPINELWNLVPADRNFNQHTKRHRLPGPGRLDTARPFLVATYEAYTRSDELSSVLLSDARARFDKGLEIDTVAGEIAHYATTFLNAVARARNLPVF